MGNKMMTCEMETCYSAPDIWSSSFTCYAGGTSLSWNPQTIQFLKQIFWTFIRKKRKSSHSSVMKCYCWTNFRRAAPCLSLRSCFFCHFHGLPLSPLINIRMYIKLDSYRWVLFEWVGNRVKLCWITGIKSRWTKFWDALYIYIYRYRYRYI